MKKYLLFVLISGMLSSSCSVHKETNSSGASWLARKIALVESLDDHQWGFALYDPDQESWVFESNADEYFTPASNTKILTLCTALQFLNDKTEAIRYVNRGDTLIFWGTGDPSFMYSVPDSNMAFEFLRNHEGPLVYAPLDPIRKYGSGWAWDDYAYAYQVERSTFPVYGNRLTFEKSASNIEGSVTPAYFRDFVIEDELQSTFVTRIPEVNSFAINLNEIDEYPFTRSIPFIVSEYDIAEILSDALGAKVSVDYGFEHPGEYRSLKGSAVDSLCKRMMQQSDNFIAEQLLVHSGSQLGESLEPRDVIKSMESEFFSSAPQEFQWFDGSGLSRYNLFTPRSLVWVLDRLYDEKGLDYLKEIFPAGGVNGTLEEWYASDDGVPFVFAKTGTLRNKHCLSGYLVCNSGRTLIFSFMHNNFVGSSREVKEAMQEVLRAIKEKY